MIINRTVVLESKQCIFFCNKIRSSQVDVLIANMAAAMARKLFTKIITVKILKFGTPQTIAIIVLKIEKFDVTLY